jgi:hypothetical protein
METQPQGAINPCERDLFPLSSEAGDPEFGYSARHNAPEVGQIRGYVDCKAVKSDPASDPYSERADLRLGGSFSDPDSNAIDGPVGRNSNVGERIDDPALQ